MRTFRSHVIPLTNTEIVARCTSDVLTVPCMYNAYYVLQALAAIQKSDFLRNSLNYPFDDRGCQNEIEFEKTKRLR